MEKIAEIIIVKTNNHLKKEGIELQKMKLGLEIILINLSKFIVIFVVAAYFNLLKETLFMSVIFGSIRRNAFGLHAKNSIVCTIISLIMFVFGACLGYQIRLNNYMVFIIFTAISILLYKYAPGDTENHPILGAKLRNKLRKQSVVTGVFLMIIAIVIPINEVKSLITLAASFEVISILPLTYKILNRGYKNYEKYERAVI
jgi:accessory gene regulator B